MFNLLNDYETVKREEIKRRRLLRLKQVRQQSKNLAIKTLNNCKQERERQLAIINQIRTDELDAWKRKFITKAQQDYVNCLQQVGQAHVAAEKENEREKKVSEQKLKNRRLAAKRGQEALVKLKLANDAKMTKVNKQRSKVADLKILEAQKSVPPPQGKNISVGTQVTDSYLEQLKPVNELNQQSLSSLSSSSSSSAEQRNDNLQYGNPKEKQSNLVDDDSMSSSLEIIENISKTKFNKKPLPFVCTREIVSSGKTNNSENLQKSTPSNTLSAFEPIHTDRVESHKKFNQVSDLIKKRHQIATEDGNAATTASDNDQPPVNVNNLENTNAIFKQSNKLEFSNTNTKSNSVTSKLRSSPVFKKPSPILGTKKSITISSSPISASKTKSKFNLKNKPPTVRPSQISKKEFIPLFIKPTESSKFMIQGNKIEIDKNRIEANQPPPPSSITSKPKIITEKDLPISETTQSTHKVQFFDHANQFSKVYDQPENLVEKYPVKYSESSAMLAAQEEIALDEERIKKLEELKKLTDLRCQKSIETENIHKDYVKLMNKLEELSEKDKLLNQNVDFNSKYSQEKLMKQSQDRQQQMNSLAEEVFHEPVLITCPKLTNNNKTNEPLLSSSGSDLNVSDFILPKKTSILKNKINFDSPEGSCNSIILGHINGSTNNNLPTETNEQCRKDLNDLLEQITKQKQLILNEKNQQSDVEIAPIIINGNSEKQNQKIPLQTFDKQKTNQTNKQNTQTQTKLPITTKIDSVSCDGVIDNDARGGGGGPINIVININGLSENPKTEYVKTEYLSEKSSAKFPKTPIKGKLTVSKPTQTITQQNFIEKENLKPQKMPNDKCNGSSVSTTYRNIPPGIPTDLTKVLKQKEKLIKQNNQLIQIKTPALCQYITRLLGMSRASIDQLGVSSVSSVQTPSSSIINVTENISTGSSNENSNADDNQINQIDDEQKMEKLKRFINENQDFISEIDKSLQEQDVNSGNLNGSLENDEESQIKAVEMAFMKTLNKKETEMKKWLKKRDKKTQTKDISPKNPLNSEIIKPILKKVTSSKIPSDKSNKLHSEPQQPIPMSTIDDAMLKHYEEITRKCNKRIANLAEMINKVREEKQKLLQNTLSTISGDGGGGGGAAAGSAASADISSTYTSITSSDKGQNSTQYLDIPEFKTQQPINQEKTDEISRIESRNNVQDNLLINSNVQIGISRDSGIFISSRPMTASLDGRDSSPDVKSITAAAATTATAATKRTAVYEKLLQNLLNGTNDNNKPNEPLAPTCFEPIIHVIEPVPQNYSSDSDDGGGNGGTNILKTNHELILMGQKVRPPKPPLSFPSSMEQQMNLPHELSTIVEVETPATSRINFSINDGQQNMTKNEQKPEEKNPILNTLKVNKFPPHEEYAAGVSDLCDSASIDAAQYESLDEFQIRKFTTHKEFVQGVSGLCDSASILEITTTSRKNENNLNGQRNLLAHSLESIDKTLVDQEIGKSVTPRPLTTTNTHVDSLENDMKELGLNWASSMIKKTKAIHSIVGTSSSTSSITSTHINDIPPPAPHKQSENALHQHSTNDVSSNNIDGDGVVGGSGKPLSLKEFLTRELIKSSNSSLSSRDDDSTLASQFLRSLLSSTDSSFIQENILPYLSDIHRTSTPVKPNLSTPPINNNSVNNQNNKKKNITSNKTETPVNDGISSKSQSNYLFSGESALSSVHSSGLSTSANNNCIVDDKLTIPNFKLVSKKSAGSGGGAGGNGTTTSSSLSSSTSISTSNTSTQTSS